MDPLSTMSKVLLFDSTNWKVKGSICCQGTWALNMEGKPHNQGRKKFFDKRKSQTEKRNWTCEYRKKKGHSKETCFKLHDVLEWYKDMMMIKGVLVNHFQGISTNKGEGENSERIQFLIKTEVQMMTSKGADCPIT